MYCLSSICCVCLKKDKELFSVSKLDDDKIPIINKLIFVAFGHERLDVNISKFICYICLNELNIAYKFKTKCLISNDIILGYNSQLKYFSGTNNDFGDLKVNLNKTSSQKKILKTLKCDYCSVRFKHGIAKKHHQIRRHGNLDRICKFCNKDCVNLKALKKHFFNAHFNHITLFCKICEEKHDSKDRFQSHLKRVHKIETFFCNQCNVKFFVKQLFLRHKSWHKKQITVEKPKVKDEKIEKTIENKEKLKIITHYLVCNKCDQIFVTQNQLEDHQRSHEMPANEIMKESENFSFKIENVTSLQEIGNFNEEIKTEEIQQCNICQKTYDSDDFNCDCNKIPENNISDIYENIKFVYCDICELKFKFEFSLRQHLKKCH